MTSSLADASARETLAAKDATDARLDSGTGELTTPTDAKLAGQFISVFWAVCMPQNVVVSFG